MRILVTGASGFVGQHLLPVLRAANHEVVGHHYQVSQNRVASCPASRTEHAISFDLRDRNEVFIAISQLQPDGIIHLAAQSSVKRSWDYPVETFESNLIGTCNILDAVRDANPKCHIVTIGSAEEYAPPMNDVLLSENSRCDPQNPYALSKYAVSNLIRQYVEAYHMRIVHARPFNHIGPGQRRSFVVPGFAFQLAQIQKENQPPVINVGNLSAIRDFSDVRDVANAYLHLVENGQAGVIYNISSGRGSSIRMLLEHMIKLIGISVELRVDPLKIRPIDVPELVGDSTRLRQTIGWQPRYNLDETIRDVLIDQGVIL